MTLNGVVSDEFCQKLMVRQVPSRGAGPGAVGVTSTSYFSIDRRHLRQHQPPLALRLNVVDAAVEHRRQRAAEEIGAEIAGPGAQLLLVDGVLLAFGDRRS